MSTAQIHPCGLARCMGPVAAAGALEMAARARVGTAWALEMAARAFLGAAGTLEMTVRARLGAAGALEIAAQAARPRWSALTRRSSPLRSEILLEPAAKPPVR